MKKEKKAAAPDEETTTATIEETTPRDLAAEISAAYVDYLLTHGQQPQSVYTFCKQLNITEADFYLHFTQFDQIDAQLWQDLANNVLTRLDADENYANYSAREQWLALAYTLVEEMLSQRSYITLCIKGEKNPLKTPIWMEFFKRDITARIDSILVNGRNSNEVAGRGFVGERYSSALWLQMRYLIDFWVKDSSKGFIKTDEAIEKSSNLAFDLLSNNAVDSAINFARFLMKK